MFFPCSIQPKIHLYQAADLSKSEMKAALPTLLQKISRFKPRFVCFVGMGIWEVIQIALSQMTMPSATVSQAARPVQQKTSKDGKNKANERKKGSGLGLQSYKFVYPADAGRLYPIGETARI